MKLTPSELADLFQGQLLVHQTITSSFEILIQTDSRQVKPGDLFIAIKGKKLDGHHFIKDAIEHGAIGIIAEKPTLPKSAFEVIVRDSSQALLSAGENALKKVHSKQIGITGSAGKTTVKELLFSVFRSSFSVDKTTGNYNTPIGVPLSILAMNPEADFFITELSASYPGEIDQNLHYLTLSEAVISSIGPSHLEFFQTVENVMQEKLKISRSLIPSGSFLLPGDNTLIQSIPKDKSYLFFGFETHNDIQATQLNYHTDGIHFKARLPGETIPDISLSTFGNHMVLNTLPVIYLARKYGIPVNIIREELSKFSAPVGRGKYHRYNKGYCVIDETYNANPLSFQAALNAFSQTPFHRKILVFSDMLELGEASDSLHKALAESIASLSLDMILYYGEYNDIIEPILQKPDQSYYYLPSLESLEQKFLQIVKPLDGVLMKASNGKHLSQIIQHLEGS